MKVASSSHFRKDMKKYLDEIEEDQEPLIVTRADNVSVVVLPLGAYSSYEETDYLLRSPANARHLRESLEQIRAGKVEKHELIEPRAGRIICIGRRMTNRFSGRLTGCSRTISVLHLPGSTSLRSYATTQQVCDHAA